MVGYYQQTRLRIHPRGPQTVRHRHHTLVTGEAAAAAWLMLFPLAGAAPEDDEPAANPTPMTTRATKTAFFTVASFF